MTTVHEPSKETGFIMVHVVISVSCCDSLHIDLEVDLHEWQINTVPYERYSLTIASTMQCLQFGVLGRQFLQLRCLWNTLEQHHHWRRTCTLE